TFEAKGPAMVQRAIEIDLVMPGPDDIHFAVRAGGRHGALDGITAVQAIATPMIDSHAAAPGAATVGAFGKENARTILRVGAAVFVVLVPGGEDRSIRTSRRTVEPEPRFVLHRRRIVADLRARIERKPGIGGALHDNALQKFAVHPVIARKMLVVQHAGIVKEQIRIAPKPIRA